MDLKTVIEIALLVLGAGIGWGVFTTKIERLKQVDDDLKEENKEQWAIVTTIRTWITEHEKDSARTRLDLEKELGKVREEASKNGGKMDQLISMIMELSKKIDRFEERLEKINEGR